jgi:peptide/nickel transport system permease protein
VIRIARSVALRAAVVVATVLGAAAVVLVMLASAPGDPIDLLPNAQEVRPVLEAEWQLDRPLPVRLASWVGRAVGGDLGTSVAYRPGTPVAELLVGPVGTSLRTWAMALFLSMTWGLALGLLTVGRRTALRGVVRWVSLGPVFLLAHALVHGLNAATWALLQAGWIGRPAWFALPDQPSELRTALAVVLLAVGSGTLAEVHAEVEDGLAAIRASGWFDAARARGMPTWPQVARNLAGPLATTAANRAATLLGGLVVVEKVLLLNGAGAVLWSAAELRDYDVAVAIAVGAAAVVCLTRLAADTTRILVDPRLSAEVA